MELWENIYQYENNVYMLPKKLDQEVAMLRLAKIGVELDVLSETQAKHIGVAVDGTYKPDYFRY